MGEHDPMLRRHWQEVLQAAERQVAVAKENLAKIALRENNDGTTEKQSA